MTTYMEHPHHGRMPVYSAEEIERARVHGWSVVGERHVQDVKEVAAAPVQVIVDVPKRRGRPPKVAA